MKFSTTASTALGLFTTTILAQATPPIESAPFSLVLISNNATYNGSVLDACHEGAAIEGLCVGAKYTGPAPYTTYNFNTSTYSKETLKGAGVPGTLVWTLPASNLNESESLKFLYSDASDVAHPQFQPGYGNVDLAFDSHNLLNVQSNVDDTKVPTTFNVTTAYYRWYICHTNTEGYYYYTLNWALGRGKPQNPTCVSTQVKRVFV